MIGMVRIIDTSFQETGGIPGRVMGGGSTRIAEREAETVAPKFYNRGNSLGDGPFLRPPVAEDSASEHARARS